MLSDRTRPLPVIGDELTVEPAPSAMEVSL
jgi:hypothetical protein